jgi:hypothetical protein
MNKSPLSASQNARNMLRAATFSVRDAQADLGRMNRKIRDDFGALRRWHSSEYQTVEGILYVGDVTTAAGTTSVSAADWSATVAECEAQAAALRGPLVASLQAASARLGYWRAECDRLAAKAS